jgi:1-deoxy-D-xylulose-5-phosphate synthase
MANLRPVVVVYSTFLQRALDQVMMDVCLHRLPVIFVLDRAGITGEDGPSTHGIFDLTFLRAMPGLTLAAASDAQELRDLLHTAVSLQDAGPFAIRFPKGAVIEGVAQPPRLLPVGEWEVLRQGAAALLLATGKMVSAAMEAAAILEIPLGTLLSRLHRGRKQLEHGLWDYAVTNGLVTTTDEDER